ncbi:hypothetical protein MTO96_040062, partial [Rhipicephalus appendiculatus]
MKLLLSGMLAGYILASSILSMTTGTPRMPAINRETLHLVGYSSKNEDTKRCVHQLKILKQRRRLGEEECELHVSH